MNRTIRHFIWGYQPHFRIIQGVHSRSLFQSLDKRFNPEVFIVGVLDEDVKSKYPACVEPEDNFWIQSEAFYGVLKNTNELIQTYPENRMLHSDQLAQKWQDEAIFKRGVQESISTVISKCPDAPAGMAYFVSFPVKQGDYLVSLVLGLQEDVLKSYYSLSISRVNFHEYRSFKIVTSLIDSVIKVYLEDVAGELLKPDPGADIGTGRSTDEILRTAGNQLMIGAASKVSPDQIGNWETLFDAFNRISSLKYERATGKGQIILAPKNHTALNAKFTLAQPVDLNNARASRKLLELAKGFALHTNGKHVFGLVETLDYTPAQEDLYEINILDYLLWEFAHNGQVLMRVRSGLPSLPAPPIDISKTRIDLSRIFKGINTEQVNILIQLVEEASRTKHGAMLVISEDAENEAQRLSNGATLLNPCLLTDFNFKQFSSIDGAVLINTNGICFAIGVILDGLATQKGDPSRGARFNSAVRYIYTRKKACMAIVVSEDGGVDLIPDLRPAINPSKIEHVLVEMESFLSSESINRSRYIQLKEWLSAHQFYLLPKDCEKANNLIKTLDENLARQAPEAWRLILPKLIPDPEFIPDIYYENNEALINDKKEKA